MAHSRFLDLLRRAARTGTGRAVSRQLPAFVRRRATRALHRHEHAHPTYSEAELLARAEEFNRNAEGHWRKIAAEPAGRAHVLNKPFSTVRDTPDILYRLGLVLSALDLGVGHTVLDFGAGSCWLSSAINRLRCRTISVDVSPTALRVGEELFRSDSRHHMELQPRFLPYDGHRIPLEPASVDRAVCFDAFHHVPNQDEVLRELFRVLRDGGRAVLAEPGEGHAHMDQSVYETEAHGVLENDLHLDDLAAKARRAGFDRVLLKPYPDASAITLDAEDYLRLIDGDDAVYPMAVLQESLRHFYIVVLTKGEPRPDSRNPRRLEARITPRPTATPLVGRASGSVRFPVTVENLGDTLWLREKNEIGGYVMLGGHLASETGDLVARGFLRAPLPRDVAPGESVEIDVELPVPPRLGRFRVELDLVDEFVAWFEQCGSKKASVELLVNAWPDSRDPHRLAAELTLASEPPGRPVKPGSPLPIRIRATNTGDTTWFTGAPAERGAVSLGAHLLHERGGLVSQDYFRLPLPHPVAPGEGALLEATVPAPPEPGRFRLRLDLVAEGVCWFEHHGSPALELPLETTSETPDSLHPGVLAARLAPALAALQTGPGAEVRLPVRVTNRGNTLWLSAPEKRHGHVALGGHLYDAARALLDLDFLRQPLPRDTAPGETVEVATSFRAPSHPGRYYLELDLVDEGVAWFRQRGSRAVEVELTVA